MFVKLREKRIFEQIVGQVKHAVLHGSLEIGDKLPPETELARIFGMSRSAVREAVRILELSGLVIIKKGNQGGCLIQDGSSNRKLIDYFSDHWRLGNITLAHITEARYRLESMVIDIVARKITKGDLKKLRKSVHKAERLYGAGKENDKIYENCYFHILLARITKNTILIDTLTAILELLSYMLVRMKPNQRITQMTFKAHREIVRLLEMGAAEMAKQVNRAHIERVYVRLSRQYKKQGGHPHDAPSPLRNMGHTLNIPRL
jgi:GntR family transcriptional regulator, transcriptional repressor for pyruvate dehydrogenase complex